MPSRIAGSISNGAPSRSVLAMRKWVARDGGEGKA